MFQVGNRRLSLLSLLIIVLIPISSAFASIQPMSALRNRKPASGLESPLTPSKPNDNCSVVLKTSASPFIESTKLFTIVNVVGFLVSVVSGGSHIHLDLFGTGAFGLVALQSIQNGSAPLSSSLAVLAWATRLTAFLTYRAIQLGHDARLDNLMTSVGGMVVFWVFSWVWGVLCTLPHTLARVEFSTHPNVWGMLLFVVGLSIEVLADFQKWMFKQNNPGQFCNVGLWAVSQHPNFFGNLLLWTGILVMNLPSLIQPGANTIMEKYGRVAVALASPLFMFFLFYSQATGAMTPATELANQKYGGDPAYQKYIDEVALIIPGVI